jgi:beta-lactamase regulating signal transducer with metallopeptidase domain
VFHFRPIFAMVELKMKGFNEEAVKKEILEQFPKMSAHVLKSEIEMRRRMYTKEQEGLKKVNIVLKFMVVFWIVIMLFVGFHIVTTLQAASKSSSSTAPTSSNLFSTFMSFTSHSEL